jgi:hypothetical protein
MRIAGVVEEIHEQGLIKIVKPVGMVEALIPTTGPDATPPLKTLLALKGRSASDLQRPRGGVRERPGAQLRAASAVGAWGGQGEGGRAGVCDRA